MDDTKDKVLFQSKYFRVVQIEAERKGKKFTKDLIERNSTVTIVPLTDTNEVYIESQYRDAFGKRIFEVVQGTMEHGADPLETAKRELAEETGLQASDWKQIATMESSTNMRSTQYLFLARGLTEGKSHLDDDEDLEVLKIPFEEALNKVLNGEIISAPQCAALLLVDKLLKEGKV